MLSTHYTLERKRDVHKSNNWPLQNKKKNISVMYVTGRAAHHETLRVGDSRGHLGSRPAIHLKHPIHDWMEPKFMDLHPKHDRNSHAYIPPRFWAVSRDQILYFQSVVKKGVDERNDYVEQCHITTRVTLRLISRTKGTDLRCMR